MLEVSECSPLGNTRKVEIFPMCIGEALGVA